MGNAQPAPSGAPVISLRVTVRADDLESFVNRYSRHLHGDRIFIFTKNPQPVGTRVRFTLQLQSGEQLLHGKGTVTRVQKEADDRRHPPGMELVFVALDDRSQTLVDFMLATREEEAPPIVRAIVPPPRKPPPTPPPSPPAPPVETAAAALPPSPEPPPELAEPPTLVAAAPVPAEPPAAVAPVAEPPVAEPPSAETGAPKAVEAPLPPLAPLRTISAPRPLVLKPSERRPLGPKPVTPPPVTPPPVVTPPLAVAPPPQDPDPIEPASLDRPSSIAIKLAENVPPSASEPVMPGPAPTFAEKWRDPLPPGAPAAGTEHTVSANPFTEVPDSAIDYFVEWSLEQSIGPRSEPTSKFSDVAMSLPGLPLVDPDAAAPRRASDRRLWTVGAIAFGVGSLLGVGLTLAVRPAPAMTTRAAVVAAPPVVAITAPIAAAPPAPAPTPAPQAPSLPPSPAGDAELVVTTRPPGALVVVDGNPIGASPATARLTAGKHAVSVSRERYATLDTSVDVPGHVLLDLKRPPTTLRIVSSPAGAEVKVAGVAHGRTPASLRLPAYESYDVQVALAGARPWRKSVYLKGATNEVLATLTVPKPARPAGKPGQR